MLTSSKHPWPALVHVFTLFMCLALQACGTSAIGYGAIEKQPTSTKSAPESGRKVLLTFLGLHGDQSCFTAIVETLQKQDKEFVHLEASPQSADELNCWGNCCGKVDGSVWETGLSCCGSEIISSGTHLGLGDIERQAIAAEKRLREQKLLKEGDEIILLGQSQGGLVLMKFWEKFHKQYNIKGAVTLVSPFGGAELIASLSSREKIQTASRLAEADHKTASTDPSTCCGCYTTSWLACCLPYCAAPAFQYCGYCCCKGVTDMTPGSTLTKSMAGIFEAMAKAGFPFLNITASCHAPEAYAGTAFGKKGMKYLISGKTTEQNNPAEDDNLIATHSQKLPIKLWQQAKQIQVAADHGINSVKGIAGNPDCFHASDGNHYYYRSFGHPKVRQAIVAFCEKHCGSREAKSKRD